MKVKKQQQTVLQLYVDWLKWVFHSKFLKNESYKSIGKECQHASYFLFQWKIFSFINNFGFFHVWYEVLM